MRGVDEYCEENVVNLHVRTNGIYNKADGVIILDFKKKKHYGDQTVLFELLKLAVILFKHGPNVY